MTRAKRLGVASGERAGTRVAGGCTSPKIGCSFDVRYRCRNTVERRLHHKDCTQQTPDRFVKITSLIVGLLLTPPCSQRSNYASPTKV